MNKMKEKVLKWLEANCDSYELNEEGQPIFQFGNDFYSFDEFILKMINEFTIS